jgi:hypothetical protein
MILIAVKQRKLEFGGCGEWRMRMSSMRIRLAAYLVASALLVTIAPAVCAQGESDVGAQINALNRRVEQLNRAGKYAEAIPLAARSAEAPIVQNMPLPSTISRTFMRRSTGLRKLCQFTFARSPS